MFPAWRKMTASPSLALRLRALFERELEVELLFAMTPQYRDATGSAAREFQVEGKKPGRVQCASARA